MEHLSLLYKYTTAETAKLILDSGRLRWSSPGMFNDTAEFQRMPRFDPSLVEAHSLLPNTICNVVFGSATIDESCLGAPMKLLLSCARVLAARGVKREEVEEMLLSERPDSDAYVDQMLRDYFASLDLNTARVLCVTARFDNDVMWGTYAGAHTGCVLGFRHLPDRDTPLLAARQVLYRDDLPIAGSGLEFLLYGNSRDLEQSTMDAVCFTKKKAWSYEQEWRVVSWRWDEGGRSYGDYKFHPEEIESVTLGVRAEDSLAREIVKLVTLRYPAATIYRMVADRGQLHRIRAGAA